MFLTIRENVSSKMVFCPLNPIRCPGGWGVYLYQVENTTFWKATPPPKVLP